MPLTSAIQNTARDQIVPGLIDPVAPGGFREYLERRGCPHTFRDEYEQRLAVAADYIGRDRFAWLNPFAKEPEDELSASRDFQRLPKPVRVKLHRAVQEYESFMGTAHAPDDVDSADALPVSSNAVATSGESGTIDVDVDVGAISVLEAARLQRSDLDDDDAFIAYLVRAGLTRKNAGEQIRLKRRALSCIGIEKSGQLSENLNDLLAQLESATQDQQITGPVYKQIRRGLIYYWFYRTNTDTGDPRFPGNKRRTTKPVEKTANFDRVGFNNYLDEEGFNSKKKSDRLSRVNRAAKLIGGERVEAIATDPHDVKNALEQAIKDNEIGHDVRTQILQALRDYAHYKLRGSPDADQVVHALRPTSNKSMSQKRSRKAVVHGTRHKTAQTGKSQRQKTSRRGSKPKVNPLDKRPVKTQAEVQAEQDEIERFKREKGITKCQTEIAAGAVPLENLGLE